MHLNENELKIVKAVLHQFFSAKKPMERKPLLLIAKSREVLDRLARWSILKTNDQNTYLPAALAFHYSGDPSYLLLARQSVQMLAHVLKNLFELEPSDRQFTSQEIEAHALMMYDSVDPEKIKLGLYLASEFNLLGGWSGNP